MENRIIALFAVAGLAVILIAGLSFQGNVVKNRPIKIGFIGPLSGEVTYGQPILDAVNLAVEEINSREGYDKYQIIVEDAQCDAGKALSAINKLAEVDDVKYVYGGVCSSETRAINPQIDRHGIISISFPILSVIAEESDNQFLVTPPTDVNIEALLRYANENEIKDIAIMYANTDYGIESRNVANRLSRDIGANIIAEETYNFGENDFKTQLIRIKASRPDAVLLLPQGFNEPLIIIKQARELGIDYVFLTEETGCAAVSLSEETFDGVTCASILAVFNTQSGKYAGFKERFVERFGYEPWLSLYQSLAYDSMYFLDEAISDSHDNVKKHLIEASYMGVGGLIDFNELGINIGFSGKDVKIIEY